jgi:hypothetical protein
MIKAIGRGFIWSIANYFGTPVHMITLYVPPGDPQEASEIVRSTQWVVEHRIKYVDPLAKIIVMGDINQH